MCETAERSRREHRRTHSADTRKRGWQEKLATSASLQNPRWHASPGSEVSVVRAPEPEKHRSFLAFASSSAAPLESAARLDEHAEDCGTIYRPRAPESEVST